MSDKENMSESIYLSTGIKELDEILAMDIDQSNDKRVTGGFLIRKKEDDREQETPVILVNGETGTGKTTLMLQIAFNAAETGSRWLPCFCSLEQTVGSLANMAQSFGGFKDIGENESKVSFCDLAELQGMPIDFNKNNPRIFMCLLAPRPITEGGNTNLFQTRLDQLNHIIAKIKGSVQDPIIPVFFIDSINAFSTEILSRNEIYRLFSLFKNNHVPAVLTMEHHGNIDLGEESDCVQNAKFLCDVAISLTKNSSAGYLKYYLEVEKSRVSRQALGRHLYKIRTYQIANKILHDPRTGIALYPSIHSVLSKAREHPSKGEAYFVSEDDDDLKNIIKSESAKPGECFSIIGPPGTHKLALGMNVSMGYNKDKPPSLLVVNFGGSGDINFGGVAWTMKRQYCRNLSRICPEEPEHEVKFWNAQYSCKTKPRNGKVIADTLVTVITFRIGQLTPEESFYVIDKVISASHEHPFSSVLLSDTAELCNGFPLLASDSLFLPALIDLFAARNLVTVCIGVNAGQSARNTDINFSLSSRADYRIVLSHFPAIHELSENTIHQYLHDGSEKDTNYPQEQLVSLVVDNVTGKHYGRELRWLYVTTEKDMKILHCEKTPENILTTNVRNRQ
jgi:KaiC/GvpD/RAD55 family RecA-like ATPase